MSLTNEPSNSSQNQVTEDRSRRNPATTSLSAQTSTTDFLTPDSRGQSRGAKTTSRTSKVQKPSATRRSMAKVIAGTPTLSQSPLFESMPRATSSTSDDSMGPVKLTKTGRVSKALKGEPVHRCNLCDKVYTRKEHLRRHQLNHSAQALKCDVRGCDKQFHRADLLNRHKEEHSSGKPNTTPDLSTTYSSASASGSNSNASPRPTNSTGFIDSRQQPRYSSQSAFQSQNTFNLGPLPTKSETIFRHTALPPAIVADSLHGHRWTSPDLPSPHPGYSTRTDAYDTEDLGQYYHHEPNTSYPLYSQSAGFSADEWLRPMDMSGSRSPTSAASSAPRVWHQDGGQRFRSLMSPTGSDLSAPYTPYDPATSGNLFDLDATAFPAVTSFDEQDAFENESIMRALSSVPHLPRLDNGQVYLGHFETRYLDAYWQNFHPVFSIIHKPSFDAAGSSSLVRALMVAIGAQFLDDECAKLVSRTLRETCMKLTAKRHHLTYSMSRLWDLQATFLAEAFSLYCSRRPSTRFSQRFEDLISGLLSDRDNVFFAKPLEALSDLTSDIVQPSDSNNRHIQWVHLESKRRLLLSCFILETQQVSFFGSSRLISDQNLPLPCSAALWQADSMDSWMALARQESMEAYSLSDAFSLGYSGNTASDAFSSNLAIAYLSNGSNAMSPMQPSDILAAIQQTPQMILYAHAALLCSHTPVRDLLAVSGETFVLGEKLATRDQFVQAVSDLRSWAGSERAVQALIHARQIIGIAYAHGQNDLLHENWVLYLATLVCWACRMWPVQDAMQDAVQSENFMLVDVENMMTQVTGADQNLSSPLDWRSARFVLEWARRRISGRLGGLLEDAAGVLGKLVDGRCIDVEPRN